MKQYDDDLLRAALKGYARQLEDINLKITEIRQKLRGRVPEVVPVLGVPAAAKPKQHHRISKEGRARIAAAQVARWKRAKAAVKKVA